MKYFILILFIFIKLTIFGQQTGLTENYVLNKLGSNPALASIDNKARLMATGQYGPNALNGNLKNYALTLEMPILKNSGISMQYSDFNYKLSKIKMLTIGIAKHVKFGDLGTISIGLNGGVANNQLDFSSDYGLSVVSEIGKSASSSADYQILKPSTLPTDFRKNQYLIGAGIYLNYDTWHLGFSKPNMIKNAIPDYLNPTKMQILERPTFISLQKDIKISSKISLTSGGLYRISKINKAQQGLDLQTSIWLNKKYSVGLWYQRIGNQTTNDPKPIIALTEVIINKVRLGYAYNFNEKPGTFTNIKQQIMFRLDFDYIKKKTSL
jgi:type IX secretion system PorP/SprF family membrane protein